MDAVRSTGPLLVVAFAGTLTLAATVGVSPSLPLDADLRFALALLVVGFGVLVFNLGGAMVIEATADAEL